MDASVNGDDGSFGPFLSDGPYQKCCNVRFLRSSSRTLRHVSNTRVEVIASRHPDRVRPIRVCGSQASSSGRQDLHGTTDSVTTYKNNYLQCRIRDFSHRKKRKALGTWYFLFAFVLLDGAIPGLGADNSKDKNTFWRLLVVSQLHVIEN
ncbi:hypothetical protein J3459_002613 [Metarhizium acridum]|nr:hypothetical protein J3459_002613 [Metarhizium acridum]